MKNEDLSVTDKRRFAADLPREFSLGDAKIKKDADEKGGRSSFQGSPSDFSKATPLQSKIQKALFVVDDVRIRTLNTLDLLKNLAKEDSLKLRGLEQKLNEFAKSADSILDPSSPATDGEAEDYLRLFSEVRDLLKANKDTIVKGMTLEQLLKKIEQDDHKKVLMDKAMVKVLSDASRNLGAPFAQFLKENIRAISTTPIRRDASNAGFGALAGPLAPLLAFTRDFIPELMDEYENTKAGFLKLKEKFFGSDEKPATSAEESLAKGLDVSKVPNEVNVDTAPIAESIAGLEKNTSKIVKHFEEEKNNSEYRANDLDDLLGKVLKNLDEISDNTREELQHTKQNSGGFIASALGTLTSLFSAFKSGKLLSFLGSSLLSVFKRGASLVGEVIKDSASFLAKRIGPILAEAGAVLGRAALAILVSPAGWATVGAVIASAVGHEIGKFLRDLLKDTSVGKWALDEKAQTEREATIKQNQTAPLPEGSILKKIEGWFSSEKKEDVPKLDVSPKKSSESGTGQALESLIRPGKIQPRAAKEFDPNELTAMIAEAIRTAGKNTPYVMRPTEERKVKTLPFMAEDTGLLFLNQGR